MGTRDDRESDDPFARYVGSFLGVGMESYRGRDEVPDMAKLHFSGHLACQTRHADGLRALLQEFFGIPVSIREFVGQWITLPESYRCRLGETPETGCLGSTAVVGARVWRKTVRDGRLFRVLQSRGIYGPSGGRC